LNEQAYEKKYEQDVKRKFDAKMSLRRRHSNDNFVVTEATPFKKNFPSGHTARMKIFFNVKVVIYEEINSGINLL